jgi:hypothetical protein
VDWLGTSDCYEHDTEPSGSIKGRNFLTSLETIHLSRRALTSWSWLMLTERMIEIFIKPKIFLTKCHHLNEITFK